MVGPDARLWDSTTERLVGAASFVESVCNIKPVAKRAAAVKRTDVRANSLVMVVSP
jgi:hypothetical protein